MTETVLNLIVGLVAINSIASARFTVDTRRVKAADYGAAFIASTVLAGLGGLVLWVWLALETGHWQFVAIIAIPLLITVGSVVTRPKAAAK